MPAQGASMTGHLLANSKALKECVCFFFFSAPGTSQCGTDTFLCYCGLFVRLISLLPVGKCTSEVSCDIRRSHGAHLELLTWKNCRVRQF